MEELQEKLKEFYIKEEEIYDLYYNHGADSTAIHEETLPSGEIVNHTKEMVIKEKIIDLCQKISSFVNNTRDEYAIADAKRVMSRLQDIIVAYFKEEANKYKF